MEKPNQRSRAFIVWLTGLSGTGKTTLAIALRDRLATTRFFEILDGDEMRATICKGLGYSKEDRQTNIYRIGCVAQQLAFNGVATIVATISPYREGRDEVRRKVSADGVPFLEIFLDVPLEVLVARDVKGLYRRALSGELAHFTGISDPYEPPERPDLRIRTDHETIEASVDRVIGVLQERGLLA
jgi:adenylylsulfate kinase